MEDHDPDPDLQVDVTHERGVAVLAVTGELDAASAPELQHALAAADGAVVLDLARCEFLDSTGLHVIIDARAGIEARGGRFAICCATQGPVARVIEVALPGVLELHPSRTAALDAVTG